MKKTAKFRRFDLPAASFRPIEYAPKTPKCTPGSGCIIMPIRLLLREKFVTAALLIRFRNENIE